MGTEGILEEVAEPDAGVDVDGDPADDGVLRRDADAGVRAELDGGGAAVPVGLPEERSQGQSIGDGIEQVVPRQNAIGAANALVLVRNSKLRAGF